MSSEHMETTNYPLSWVRQDIEQRLFFAGGRFTRVNTWLSLVIGILIALCAYGLLLLLPRYVYQWRTDQLKEMFTKGVIPYCIVLLASWSIAILAIKGRKHALQRKALRYMVVPDDPDFVLAPSTVDQVRKNIQRTVRRRASLPPV